MYEDLFADNLVDIPADIERVIEGDDHENYADNESEKDQNENGSDQEEKNDEDKSKKDTDKPKIRKHFGPRVVLNAERLIGPRGIGIMESFFSDIKLHGKRKEKEDLEVVMKRLELWTHRLVPRFHFDDSLKKIEKLGSKKIVGTHLKIARYGRNDDVAVSRGLSEEVPDSPPPPAEDPFDQLLVSSTSSHPSDTNITTEQRDQMLRNRLIAEERRADRIKKAQEMKLKFQSQNSVNLSQPQSTETSSSQNFKNPNSQSIEMAENPSVREQPTGKEILTDEGHITKLLQSECTDVNKENIDDLKLRVLQSEKVNTQQRSSSVTKAVILNEVIQNQIVDSSRQNNFSDDDNALLETHQNEDVNMEENYSLITEKENVLNDSVDKLLTSEMTNDKNIDDQVEQTDVEMDIDVQNCIDKKNEVNLEFRDMQSEKVNNSSVTKDTKQNEVFQNQTVVNSHNNNISENTVALETHQDEDACLKENYSLITEKENVLNSPVDKLLMPEITKDKNIDDQFEQTDVEMDSDVQNGIDKKSEEDFV